MATSLAAQLAQIAAKSKNSLNVKAQKAAHSKSLIFEARVAAGQSLQAIYTLCQDGFEELCQLDSRFAQFSNTLFSVQSQEEDRTQMTRAENDELDKKIEHFLRLCGGKLRLMPAIKAIEWLIRRFRIHEYNTAALIAEFLPYHSIPTFVTMMSILPPEIPHEYKFLDPYIRSLTAPPRAAIVHQATRHSNLLSAISSHTLESCEAQQHYPALVAFWAGIMTEAVNGMIDNQKSGRKSLQQDRNQSLLQQIGPTLGKALVMNRAPGLQIASYMVTAVLASKGTLEDTALSVFMEQLVIGWTDETLRPGLVCLSILAQHRPAKQLSRRVTRALLKVQNLAQILGELRTAHRVDRLAGGYVLALLDRLTRKGAIDCLPVIRSILTGDILQEKQLVIAFKALLVAPFNITDDLDQDGSIRKEIGSCLVILAQETGSAGVTIRKVIEDADFDIDELELKLGASIRPRAFLKAAEEESTISSGAKDNGHPEVLEATLARLSVAGTPASCLSRGSDTIFEDLCQLFLAVAADTAELAKFDSSPLLRRTEATSQCFYLTFYARIWLGPYPTLARVIALELARSRLEMDDAAQVDFQAILPYSIAAMADPAKKVRRAAAQVLTVLNNQSKTPGERATQNACWGHEQLYETLDDLKWLSPDESSCLLRTIVMPALEESVIDQDHLSEVLQSALGRPTKSTEKEKSTSLSQSTRLSILKFLSGHVIYTPLLALKARLLQPLNQVRGVSNTTRTQLLLPLLQWWASLAPDNAKYIAARESLDEATMNSCCVDVVVPNDKSGAECFLEIIKGPASKDRPDLIQSIFSGIRKMWPSMKGEARFFVAQAMMELTQRTSSEADEPDLIAAEAAELLRNVELNTDILSNFLDSIQVEPESPPAKRRRTSFSEPNHGVSNMTELRPILSNITLVLQLIEGSNPAQHPELLQGLFGVLSKLRILRSLLGSELGYLQNLILSSLLAMMPAYKDNNNLRLDSSIGYGDNLVQCIQKSTSPAVQNTALLLVASLAKTAPDTILHCVMPIFTLMGGSVLRQSDEYSAHVVNQTIKEVVPPLIETFRKGKRNVVASASELLSSFVLAYDHIPSHRKHDLFISLIESLGAEDFLFAIVAMCANRFATESTTSFLLEIMSSFTAEVQLQTLIHIVELTGDIFKPKPHLSAILLGKKEDPTYDLQKAALKELNLLPQLLSNRKLKDEIGRLAGRDDMEAARIRELYAKLLEDILTLADTVKSKKSLHNRCGDVLANLLNLLAIGEFIKAVETLLDRPNVGLRQKVLRALEVRVDGESSADSASRMTLLAFLPQLTAVIRNSVDIPYKYTAVQCVDKVAEKYGKKDIEAVTAAAAVIASDHCLGQPERRLRIMSLLCLASLVDVLQDSVVSILPDAVPKALAYLRGSIDGVDSDIELHNAAYSYMAALSQHVPYMISGAYLDELLNCSNLSAGAPLDDDSNDSRLQCLQLVAERIDAKVLFVALQRNWPHAVDAGPTATGEYLHVLGSGIDKQPKSAIAKNTTPLTEIFQNALDLRRVESLKAKSTSDMQSRLDEIEEAVNKVALKMIYKLNDAAFRPIFSQLLEWSDSKSSKMSGREVTLRRLSTFGFLFTFFDNLKSIVTSYASYILDSAAGILQNVNPKDKEERELWKRVLKTLAQCFEHDQDGFWQAPSHFGGIAPALLEQFLHGTTLDVTEDLIPAVVALADVADSQDHQKELNMAILKHLRSPHGAVRLAGVMCQQALTDKLGEDWLAMLPEMLPYISELQDDDDDAVDRETHRWIVKIEGVLGESLDSMLQ